MQQVRIRIIILLSALLTAFPRTIPGKAVCHSLWPDKLPHYNNQKSHHLSDSLPPLLSQQRACAKETSSGRWCASSRATPRAPRPPRCRGWSAAGAAAAAGTAACPCAARGGNTSSSAWMAPPSRRNWRDTWSAAAPSARKPSLGLSPL